MSSASTFSGGSKIADSTKFAHAAISFDSSTMRLAQLDAPAFEGEADIDSSIASCRFRIIESDAI
jgi:hypothetical protein